MTRLFALLLAVLGFQMLLLGLPGLPGAVLFLMMAVGMARKRPTSDSAKG